MFLFKTWYYLFAAFVYVIAGVGDILHAIRTGDWHLSWKRRMPLKEVLPELHFHHGAGH
jgi:hypothetical protein